MQKLLIVTRHTPLPWEDGAGAYLHDLARFLSQHGFQVELLWLNPPEHVRWSRIWHLPETFASSISLHLSGSLRLGRRFIFPGVIWQPFKAKCFHQARRALGLFGIRPARRNRNVNAIGVSMATQTVDNGVRAWMSPPSAQELETVEQFSKKYRPDIVIANYAWMCPILNLSIHREAKKICLAHDVIWKRAALSAGKNGNSRPEITRHDESAWLRGADLIITISEADAAELRQLAPASRVIVAPKALEARALDSKPSTPRLLFVGSDNDFNYEGLDWFLVQVWPLILEKMPDVALDICGSINRRFSSPVPNVTFHGMVSKLDDFYQRTAVAIVPLLRATGMNIKLVEAAAFGRAIVTTPLTLEGAPLLKGAAITAESPEEFSAAVLRLLENPEMRMAVERNIFARVENHLTPEACYGPLVPCFSQHK